MLCKRLVESKISNGLRPLKNPFVSLCAAYMRKLIVRILDVHMGFVVGTDASTL